MCLKATHVKPAFLNLNETKFKFCALLETPGVQQITFNRQENGHVPFNTCGHYCFIWTGTSGESDVIKNKKKCYKVATRLSQCLALCKNLTHVLVKSELLPVTGNQQVVSHYPKFFYFCPLVFWGNGWVWANLSPLTFKHIQSARWAWEIVAV